MRQARLVVPSRDQVIKTNQQDVGPNRYYARNPLVRGLYRRRLELALELLVRHRVHRMLDVGCGNAFLLPSLQQVAQQVVAIDVHSLLGEVKRRIPGPYVRASLATLPFKAGSFDAISCMSVLEHLDWTDLAVRELRRVMDRKSVLVVGIPSDHLVVRLFFWAVRSPALRAHVATHAHLMRTLRESFAMTRRLDLSLGPALLYSVLECRPRQDRE